MIIHDKIKNNTKLCMLENNWYLTDENGQLFAEKDKKKCNSYKVIQR